ncbi:alpha/beta hydrolase [Luteolibacter arcticus]|uniref:Alpha/beta hydrolase n=1 Tax=Luteolibacter arcticus TaxID=1581411 RepID=A0ABT3GK29_9BACT|nr:alpha/beta hydrolase [Luteolibacter arcticus]MCW1923840.1 alpha/beta hydrolase [Luteolibacter arcticus]
MKFHSTFPCLAGVFVFAGCASKPLPPDEALHRSAAVHLKEAGAKATPDEQRAALYLQSAAEAHALLGSASSGEASRVIYNKAATDLTVLLRNADQGKMWNRPLTLAANGTTYRLRYSPGTRDGVWSPQYFTDFKPAAEVPDGTIDAKNRQDGIGGALVGVHKTTPLEAFSPRVGVAAPVTAILDFKGQEATLTLIDPVERPKFAVAGKERVMDADFSAPLAYYPQKSELWNGLMGAFRVTHYMGNTGLYQLEPYDRDRIPLIFVHGLISTPQMWRNVINEVEKDPVLRERYQCMVFGYPTGNPPGYSALRLREELAKFEKLHPEARNYVLVGHSMGGLVSRMQAATVNRESWNAIGKDKADKLFAHVEPGSLMDRATAFKANPRVDRLVFICTPHRGSEMALGRIGDLGRRLISLPVDLTGTITKSMGDAMSIATGAPGRIPNSVTGLSPTNPMLKVLDSRPIEAPYHTILGDRGRGDGTLSSDGVVKYWSSHLTTAKSECVVPGPHGACEMPQTIEELRRILHLHLKESGAGR